MLDRRWWTHILLVTLQWDSSEGSASWSLRMSRQDRAPTAESGNVSVADRL